MTAQWAVRAGLTEGRRGPRGDSPHLHQTSAIAGVFHFVRFIGQKSGGIEPGPEVNDSPVGCQSRADRGPARRERRFPSPPLRPQQSLGFFILQDEWTKEQGNRTWPGRE